MSVAPGPPDLGIGSWPSRRARMTPGAVAFRQGVRSLTYADLADRVDALAAGLAARGVSAGDRVAWLGANDIATFETLFAAGRLGAIFVPLNTRLSPVEIHYMLEDCGARVLVFGPDTADLVVAAAPAGAGVAVVVGLTTDYEPLIAAGRGAVLPATEIGLGDDALLLYTSGTTGRPKGAVLTHGNMTFNTMNQLAHVDVLSTDVVVCTAPLFHVTGLGQVSMPTLFKGGTVVMPPGFDPAWLLRTIADLQITAFSAVPTMLQMICDHPDWTGADLRSLRYVIYGGSPVAERVATSWLGRGVPVLQGYGMTEAAPGVFLALTQGAREQPVSAGVPHFFTDIALTGPQGPTTGPGTGELLVRGLNVFRGYWNRPQETAAAFEGGWFHSGDVVRLATDGWAHVVDRLKDMFISGGENVYPAEVEAVLAQLPQVADSAVVGVPDELWGETGHAFVTLHAGARLDAAAVKIHLLGRLGRYKVPRYISFMTDLPRTATGKVRKSALRDLPPSCDAPSG